MSNSSFDDIWNQALEGYLRSTGRTSQDHAMLKQLHNTDDLLKQLEAGQREFGDWRNKHPRTFSALSKAIKPLDFSLKIAQSAVSVTPFAPASTVFGAVLFLVQASNGVSQAYELIDQLFDKLGEFTTRLGTYINGGMGSPLQHKVVEILACLLEILGRSEKVIRNGRLRVFTTILFFGQDEKVMALFDRLSQLVDDEQKLVIALSHGMIQQMGRKVDKVDMDTERNVEVLEGVEKGLDQLVFSIQDATSKGRAVEQNVLLDKSLVTPALIKNLALYTGYSEDVILGSGQWLLAESTFRTWLDRKSPLLWVAGGPGTGKSFLSATAISELQNTYPQHPQHPSRVSVGFFYVKEHDQDLQDLGNMLKSIAHQIAQVDPVFMSHVISLSSKPESVISPRKIWENLFLNFFGPTRELTNTAMIVIDGLDEAPKKTIKELFRCLEDLEDLRQVQSRLCFALFGRPELAEYIHPHLQRCTSFIEIGEKNEVDIELYIKQNMMEVLVVRQTLELKSKMAASKLARKIRDKLMAKADGMFFKVVLIMNQLYEKERVSAIFETIEDSPQQLKAMIRHVFERLASNQDINREDLNEILVWVAYSKRPLFIGELYAVLTQRTGKAHDALEGRLRGRFASLFKLTRQPVLQIAPEEEVRGVKVDEENSSDIDLFSDEDEITGDSEEAPLREDADSESIGNEQLNENTMKTFWTTDVRFTHASIRDYLVEEGNLELGAHSGDTGIGIKTQTADLYLASMCVQNILDLENMPENDISHMGITAYSAQYFMDHILSIDPCRISQEKKQPFIRQLCRLLLNETGIRNLIQLTQSDPNKALHMWFENAQFSTSIRRDWLSDALEDQFSPSEYEWLKKAASSAKALFFPLAVEASRMWLTKCGHDDLAYCNDRFRLYQTWIIYLYLKMDDDDIQEVKNLNIGSLTAGRPPSYELDRLQALVELSELDQTQHWHTCFGWILMEGKQYNEAMKHFNKALEIDDKSWKALQGLSKCILEEEKYNEAAKCLEHALHVVPNVLRSAISALRGDLTSVILSKRDFKSALRLARDAYTSDSTDLQATEDYVKALYAQHDYGQILDIVLNFLQLQRGFNFLTLRNVHQEIGSALRVEGRIDLVKLQIDIALSSNDLRKAPWLVAWVAEFQYSFYDEVDESMALFESILGPAFKSNLRPELLWAYEYASFSAEQYLSKIYFTKAIAARVAGEDPECWLNKLKKFACSDETSSYINPTYKKNDAALFLGIYLHRYGNADESTWKACFRNSVLQSIDVLGDKDPMNDQSVYNWLFSLLLAAGNESNAVAAAAVALMPLEASPDPILSKALKVINFSAPGRRCNGPCDTKFNSYRESPYKELYSCRDCLDTDFCEDCFPIVKRGEMPYRACSPEHTFLQIYPIPKEAKNVAACFVDMKTMKVNKEWLDALRKEWS